MWFSYLKDWRGGGGAVEAFFWGGGAVKKNTLYIVNTSMRATELFLLGPVHGSRKKSSPSYQQNYDALLDSNLLFSGWYQIVLDVFRWSQLFSVVFSWVVTFMDNHPLCGHFFSGWCQMFSDVPEMISDVPEMFSDVLSCFQMFSGCPQLITYIL